MMKVVFVARGLPIGEYSVLRRHDWARIRRRCCARCRDGSAFPMFVKPANLGSSVGISKANVAGELRDAIDLAAEYDRKILIEAGVPNPREIECAVLGNDDPQASVAGEIIPSREFYDYESKYLDEGSKIPHSGRPAGTHGRGSAAAGARGVQAIDGAGMARVDFLLERDDRHALRERSEHDSRLYDDQHVRQAAGRHRPRLSAPARSADAARARAA